MSIDSHFIHKCDIKRPYSGSGNENAHGLSDESSLSVDTGVRFRLVAKRQRIWKSETSESAVVTVYHGLFSAGVDLQERDELVNITLEDGEGLDESFEIERILPRRTNSAHHLSAELKRVS